MRRFDVPRRECLKIAAMTALGSLLPARVMSGKNPTCAPPITNGVPANGGQCPYPIPWLDKNGNHNQMPKANVELNHIFHFKGKLARCAGFRGMGTDTHGNRLAWGTGTTDFSYIAGEYWAARKAQQGVYAHI